MSLHHQLQLIAWAVLFAALAEALYRSGWSYR